MLSKDSRIGSPDKIKRLLRSGLEAKSKKLTFRYEESQEELSQFAVVVSGKISKKAVERNKLRRQIMEAIKKELSSLKKSYNMVVIARALDASYQELQDNIKDVFNSL